MKKETYSFTVHIGNKTQEITNTELKRYAEMIGLQAIAAGRYSWLFAIDLLLYERVYSIDPYMIIDEIKALEGIKQSVGTKKATQFKKLPLKGLWHKHFFSTRFMAHNIRNELKGEKRKRLTEEIFDPKKQPKVTQKMINEFAHRATFDPIKERNDDCRLTGEWIVFGKHDGKPYYLCLATHNMGDEEIYKRIKSVCFMQFPFLDSSGV